MAQKFLTGVQLIDGSAGSPALSFSSDTNTGIYRSEDDTVNISVGGTSRFYVNSSGIVSSANVYSGGNGQFRNYSGVWKATTGVSGNGFEFSSADQTGAMTLTSNGNLKVHNNIRSQGHSTTGLSGKGMELRFFTDTDIGSILSYDRSNNAYLPIGVFGSTVSLQTNGTERLHITNAGNVGIGTGTPGYKLDVSGSLRATGESTFTSNLLFPDNSQIKLGTGQDFQIYHDGSNARIYNDTGDLYIRNNADDKDIYFQSDNGAGSIETYFFLDGSAGGTNPITIFPDSSYLKFGSSQDLSIAHTGSYSEISHNGTGNLIIQNTTDDADIIFKSDNGSGGVTDYFYLDGSSTQVKYDVNLKIHDNKKLIVGDGDDLQIFHDGTTTNISNNAGNLSIINHADDGDIKFFSDDGSGGVAEYFRLDGGIVEVVFSKSTRHMDNVQAKFGSGEDLKIFHDGSGSKVENYTGNLTIQQRADDSDIVFQCDDGSGDLTDYFRLDGSATNMKVSKDIRFFTNVDAEFGTGGDFKIYHDGSNQYLDMINSGTGNIVIQNQNDDSDIIFKSDDGSGGIATYFFLDGSSVTTQFYKTLKLYDAAQIYIGDDNDFRFYHNGTSNIDNYTGNLDIIQRHNDGDIRFYNDNGSGGTAQYFRVDGGITKTVFIRDTKHEDSVKGLFGTNDDLQIYHDGSNSYIKQQGAATGDLIIEQNVDDGDIIFRSDNGSGGLAEYFRLDGNLGYMVASKHILLDDNVKLRVGSSADLEIYHDGTNSYIQDASGTGDIRIASNIVHLNNAASTEVMLKAIENGAVELYYNDNKKLETTNTGVNITGNLTVSGTTTTVNQTNLDVSDNIIGLNRGASTNTNDSGLIIERGSTGDNAAFLWDESEDKFVFGLTTATPSATGNVSLSDFRGIKTGPITASGSITASSDVTTSGSYFADTHFRSTDGNATLSATGGGGVYLRPNGFSSTTGQVLIDAANGDATFSGGLSVNTSGSIYGTDNQIASIYMTGSGYGLSGKFGTYARNIIRSNGTNTIQIGDNTSLISLIQLKAGSSSVDGVIQLMTHNTERMRVTHDGRVGVNTSSPGAKLHVVESTTNTQALRVDDGTSFVSVVPSLGSGGYTGVSSAGDIGLIFSIDGDNTTDTTNGLLIAPHTQTSGGLKILENGNVGIGVATPNTKLQVAGIIQSTESGNSAFYGGDYVRVFNNQNFRFRNSGGSAIANIAMSGNTYFNGGNFGIGTTAPAKQLTISSTTPFIRLEENQSGGNKRLDLWVDQNAVAHIDANQSASQITLRTASTDRLRITNAGNVGIGTTSPGKKLDVLGDIRSIDSNSNNHQLRATQVISYGTDAILNAQSSGDDVRLNTQGNTRLIATAEGNVGIGTTSPQTNTSLHVDGATRAGGKTSWSDRDGAQLTTTGRVVAGLTGDANGNGASAMYIFTCYGGNGYQRIVYSCRNQGGTWVVNKDIDEGVDAFDVVASTPSSGSAVTFTFKGRTSSQSYTASVFIEHMGHNLDTQYVG